MRMPRSTTSTPMLPPSTTSRSSAAPSTTTYQSASTIRTPTPYITDSRSDSVVSRWAPGTTSNARTPRPPSTMRSRSRAASTIGASESRNMICAVSEARGVTPSVGVAFVDVTNGQAVLSQINDTQFYIKTVLKIQVNEPSKVLIVSTACPPHKSALCATIEEELPGVTIVPLNRKYWSEAVGSELIQTLSFREDVETIKVALEGSFYAVCSFAAVMKYLELQSSIRIANHSLRITYQPCEDSMMINLSTIQSLELIQNLHNVKSKQCLFGLLNETLTPMGTRTLRSNILQPSTVKDTTLNPRYDAVAELMVNEEMLFSVRTSLKAFADVEKLLTQLIIVPNRDDLYETEQAINNVLKVKKYVMAIPSLFDAVESSNCALLQKIKTLCRPALTDQVMALISGVVNEDAIFADSPLELRHQRTWGVKSGVHSLLDVARKIYKETTDDLHQHIQDLNTELELAADLRYENGRRYFLRFRAADLRDRELPDVFINRVNTKDFVECQTMTVLQFNQKISDAVNEVAMQSHKAILELLDKLRQHVPAMFRICEGIALVDMLAGFSHLASKHGYVRPDLSGALAVKAARHPIMEVPRPDKFIPNDYYATEQYRFQIITGCNMSGKSTYIRTVALVQIMAQVGSFIPAEFAALPVVDQLFSRLSTDDSIESNMSSFSVEMREMAFISRNMSEKSLVIIDELGRGTSTRDGLAIAIAIAEALIEEKALVFFTTHFSELAKVLADRPGVLNLHLASETTAAQTADALPRMTMLYKVSSGPLAEHDYGIKLARAIGFPERFVAAAERATGALRAQAEARKRGSEERRRAARRRLVLNLREALVQAERSGMDDAALGSYLRRLQREFVERMQRLEDLRRDESGQGEEAVTEEEQDGVAGEGVGRSVEAAGVAEDSSDDEVLLIRSIERDDDAEGAE